ncbi:MAG: hypothetical protein COV07_04210 [Candidatus Vogelbacteria bacterium CG10_big_fil_rev_8_21_14_0_10_45_14]|uniref:Uncharacterized protein n=1 Tax=Candidatus Vogelbacteria bacterium CG10_big_fil_rev_8_21_14_0_10_45_14 TaxID=1975042 RepID=A0A2H0RIZ8_9BACT|nr:MAG: hypothetical protein COV07_04210 [Candidatus Vogelbacteria bacterium CG10_big_fil_rev_8_21_14_0_10_45_14]
MKEEPQTQDVAIEKTFSSERDVNGINLKMIVDIPKGGPGIKTLEVNGVIVPFGEIVKLSNELDAQLKAHWQDASRERAKNAPRLGEGTSD